MTEDTPRQLVYLPIHLWETLRELWVYGDEAYELRDALTSRYVVRCLQVALTTEDSKALNVALREATEAEKEAVLDGNMNYVVFRPARLALLRAILAEPHPENRPLPFAAHLFEQLSRTLAWDEISPQVGCISSIPTVPHASGLAKEVAALAAGLVRERPPSVVAAVEDGAGLRVCEDRWRNYVNRTVETLKQLV
ncbi:MAG: hypothetical protein ACFB50_12155 [Rubrobacteraceae bacterium]